MLSPQVKRIAFALYEANGTPVSLSCYLLLKYGEFDQLSSKAVNPADYVSRDTFFRDNSSCCFLKKFQFPTSSEARQKRALETFLQCELKNKETNDRMRHLNWLVHEDWPEHPLADVVAFVRRWRRVVKRMLGPVPDDLSGRFGPGATFRDKGRLTSALDKMSSVPTCTPDARCLLPTWRDAWSRAHTSGPHRGYVATDRGNRFTTVPKDGLTDRAICVEPSLNVWFQLAVGSVLRERLRSFGIDLNHGQTKHRSMVCSQEYSTIDLSSASDTVSKELVRLILPDEWYELLSTLRSPATQIAGRWYLQEKFSSMGNGFTFELETLIFATLIATLRPSVRMDYNGPGLRRGSDFSVYGDDLIVAPELYSDLSAALVFFGFKPNPRKSFHTGRFFESCGMDSFDGLPSRGFYLKEECHEPADFIKLANGLRALASRYSGDCDVYNLYLRPWLMALDGIPVSIRDCRGPESLGDLCIHDRKSSHAIRIRNGVTSYRTWSPVLARIPTSHWRESVIYAGVLYGCVSGGNPERHSPDYVSVRGNVSGHRVKWVDH